MPISYVIDPPRDIIVETWTGIVDAATLGAYWRSYTLDPEVMRCRRTLVDLRAAEMDFSGTELDDLVRTIVIPVLGDRKWASALLVGAPAQYGKSRQYQVFAERYSTDAIFTDRDAAERWLMEQQL